MTGIIQQVALECTKGSSNKFYNINIMLDINGIVYVETWYGPIGKKGQPGAVGNSSFDAKECIANRTVDGHAAKIASEANKLMDSKIKKGYEVVSKTQWIDPVSIIKMLHSRFPAEAKEVTQQPKEPVDGSFEVEVISVAAGVIRVAKVLEDFSYQVLGEALNPKHRDVKTGAVISVLAQNNQLVVA